MTTALSLNNLEVSIGTSKVLHGISLKVNQGEVVALVGRNGAGKTTTIRSIIGQLTADTGSVTYFGEDITNGNTHEIVRNGIGYAPEESEIFELTTEDNIEMATWARESSRSREERVEHAYDIFPVLKEYRSKLGTQCSGGERKMLAMARTVAMDPDLYLLDEPFEGLAPAIIPTIQDGIKEIANSENASILLAESNIHHVPPYVDRIYVIERGELIFDGTLDEAREEDQLMEIIAQR